MARRLSAAIGLTALALAGSANAQANIRDGAYKTPDGKKECGVYSADTKTPYDLRAFDWRTYGKKLVREQSITCDDSAEPRLHVFVLNGRIHSFAYNGSLPVHIVSPSDYEAHVKFIGERAASESYASEGSSRVAEVGKRFNETLDAAKKHPVGK